MPTPARTRSKGLMAASLALLGALGGQCLLCRQGSRTRLCEACIGTARQAADRDRAARCETCALPLRAAASLRCARCRRQPPALDHCLAALDYAHPWDRLLLDFKFNARPQLARPLAELMLDLSSPATRPDLLCCVPLSRERMAERGYNQSHELARRLAGPLGLPYAPRLLRRLPGPVQSRLDAAQRRREVQGAFLLSPGQAARARGACITVVDDVMTTGATLDEVARTLKRAGAREVRAWVLMRAT
ncbi:ComF family protein [Pelomonas sp. APW6]|uniref:ComF family protein n=1 Tax=Roseateles subflavus TaxID=3053353 RepID=A0ABT7LMS2_9BURK|nr:ComF family protein [Pelomonas sp. APW6]MDL5032816.1 ComF family protein [Pelomonas sp. APW6]